MYVFICLCIAIFMIGGNALSVTIAGITARIGELCALVLGGALAPYAVKQRLNTSMLAMLMWAILSVVLIICNNFVYDFGTSAVVIAFFYLFRFTYLIFLAYVLAKYLKQNKKVTCTLWVVNICYVIICAIGFFQLIFYPIAFDWYAVFYKIGVVWAGDPHEYRLISTDFDPNYLACCLLIGIVVNLYLMQSDKGAKGWGMVKYYLILALYIITILFTKSRSGIVGIGIIVIFYYLLSLNLKNLKLSDGIILGLIVFVGGYLVLFSNISVFVRIRGVFTDDSAGARFESWAQGFEIMKNTNFLGIGYNTFLAYNEKVYGVIESQKSAALDSSLQLILVTSGILGTILFAVHYVRLFIDSKNKGFRCLMIAALVVCNFNNVLFYSLWVLPFYLVGYLISQPQRDKVLGLQINLKKSAVA